MQVRLLLENLKESTLEDLSIDEKTVLQQISKEMGWNGTIGFTWLRIGTRSRIL